MNTFTKTLLKKLSFDWQRWHINIPGPTAGPGRRTISTSRLSKRNIQCQLQSTSARQNTLRTSQFFRQSQSTEQRQRAEEQQQECGIPQEPRRRKKNNCDVHGGHLKLTSSACWIHVHVVPKKGLHGSTWTSHSQGIVFILPVRLSSIALANYHR